MVKEWNRPRLRDKRAPGVIAGPEILMVSPGGGAPGFLSVFLRGPGPRRFFFLSKGAEPRVGESIGWGPGGGSETSG